MFDVPYIGEDCALHGCYLVGVRAKYLHDDVRTFTWWG
jgi:hypothetical protein